MGRSSVGRKKRKCHFLAESALYLTFLVTLLLLACPQCQPTCRQRSQWSRWSGNFQTGHALVVSTVWTLPWARAPLSLTLHHQIRSAQRLWMQNWMCMISSLILVKRLRTSPEHTSFWYLLSYYTWQLRPKFWHNLDRARGLANKNMFIKQDFLFINMSWSVISRCCCVLENHMLHVLCFSSDIMMPVRLGVTSNLNKHQALVCYPPFAQCLSCSAPTSFATAVV